MNFRYFAVLALASQLFATDYITVYQERGIKGLERVLDVSLATTEYWDEQLKDKNVTYGLYDSFENLLICNKETAELKRYSKNGIHNFMEDTQLSTFLGKVKGDKKVEGDLKTPIGVYTFTKKLSYVDQFYGPLALVTNYPNPYDQSQKKTGSGIWIHGLPLKGDRDNFTKGCLAIDNEDLIKLDKNIDPKKTALIIAPKETEAVDKKNISKILATLFQWRNAWKYNKLESYLSFYDADFKKPNGIGFKDFKQYKSTVFENKRRKHIDLSQINIIPYPNLDGQKLFLISFYEQYHSGSVHFQGYKELYVKLLDHGFSIITEN